MSEKEKLFEELKIIEEIEKPNKHGFTSESHLNLTIKQILSLNYSKVNLKFIDKRLPYCVIKSGANTYISDIFKDFKVPEQGQSFQMYVF